MLELGGGVGFTGFRFSFQLGKDDGDPILGLLSWNCSSL